MSSKSWHATSRHDGCMPSWILCLQTGVCTRSLQGQIWWSHSGTFVRAKPNKLELPYPADSVQTGKPLVVYRYSYNWHHNIGMQLCAAGRLGAALGLFDFKSQKSSESLCVYGQTLWVYDFSSVADSRLLFWCCRQYCSVALMQTYLSLCFTKCFNISVFSRLLCCTFFYLCWKRLLTFPFKGKL